MEPSSQSYPPSGNLDVPDALRRAWQLHQKGRFDEAASICQAILNTAPNQPDALYLLGIIFKHEGNAKQALQALWRATEVKPDFATAQFELGVLAKELGDNHTAAVALQKALAIDPRIAEAHFHLGHIFQQRGQFGLAIEAYQKATSIKPDHFDAHFNSAMIVDDLGLGLEAKRRYTLAAAIRPVHLLAAWGANLTLPPIYDDEAEIESCRKQWETGIRRLLDEVDGRFRADAVNALNAISWKTNFYLHYQGCDNTSLQRLFGELISKVAAGACPEFCRPLARRKLKADEKLRLGFASGFFRNHTISKLFGSWISEFDRARFEVHSLDFGTGSDETTEIVKRQSIHHALGSRQPRDIAEYVFGLELDVIVYLDVGMTPKIQPLAALRLAPIQCCAWGHPITTGLPTIDYFLSSDLMEPERAEQHYVEKLVRLPNLSIYYPFPKLALDPSPRAARSAGRPLFFCSQSLFKLLPRFDAICTKIARCLPAAQFCFLADRSSLVTDKFRNRLARAFTAEGLRFESHVMVKERLTEPEFFKLNQSATAILDSIWWSGGNTSLEGLACDKPIVTHAGPMMRGRHTTGILRRAGLDELIANDASEYVEIAVRLAEDASWRTHVEERIRAQKHLVYGDRTPINALEDFLCSFFEAP